MHLHRIDPCRFSNGGFYPSRRMPESCSFRLRLRLMLMKPKSLHSKEYRLGRLCAIRLSIAGSLSFPVFVIYSRSIIQDLE